MSSLSDLMFSKSIYVVSSGRTSAFLWVNNVPWARGAEGCFWQLRDYELVSFLRQSLRTCSKASKNFCLWSWLKPTHISSFLAKEGHWPCFMNNQLCIPSAQKYWYTQQPGILTSFFDETRSILTSEPVYDLAFLSGGGGGRGRQFVEPVKLFEGLN